MIMKRMTVVLQDEELYLALKAQASSQQRTLGSIITEALEDWLQAKEDTEDAAAAGAAMREEGANIPCENVKRELRTSGGPN